MLTMAMKLLIGTEETQDRRDVRQHLAGVLRSGST